MLQTAYFLLYGDACHLLSVHRCNGNDSPHINDPLPSPRHTAFHQIHPNILCAISNVNSPHEGRQSRWWCHWGLMKDTTELHYVHHTIGFIVISISLFWKYCFKNSCPHLFKCIVCLKIFLTLIHPHSFCLRERQRLERLWPFLKVQKVTVLQMQLKQLNNLSPI